MIRKKHTGNRCTELSLTDAISNNSYFHRFVYLYFLSSLSWVLWGETRITSVAKKEVMLSTDLSLWELLSSMQVWFGLTWRGAFLEMPLEGTPCFSCGSRASLQLTQPWMGHAAGFPPAQPTILQEAPLPTHWWWDIQQQAVQAPRTV